MNGRTPLEKKSTVQAVSTAQGLVFLCVVSLSLILSVGLAQPPDNAIPGRTGGSAGSTLSPQYAVIDLGTNMVNPIKITDSGYVLGNSSTNSFSWGQWNYYVWYNGQPTPLQPGPNLYTDYLQWEATDIAEDGTVVGTETDAFNGTVTYDGPPNELSELDEWSVGSLQPVVTAPPLYGSFSLGSYQYGGYISGGDDLGEPDVGNSAPPITATAGGPFIVSHSGAPPTIWSVQEKSRMPGTNASISLDGFVGTNEMGTFPGTGTVPTGNAVFPMAANTNSECLTETESNYYDAPGYEEWGPYWLPSSSTFAVGSQTVANGYIPVGNYPLSNISALGKHYVLLQAATIQGVTVNYPSVASYLCWDGTVTYTLTAPNIMGSSSPIVPAAVNAMTASIPTTNGPPQVVPATQVIGNAGVVINNNYLNQGYIWQLQPPVGTNNGVFNPPQMLDSLVSTNSGWSYISANSINDSGAIVGTATYSGTNTAIAQGSHGVLLLPVQLSCPIADTTANLTDSAGNSLGVAPDNNPTYFTQANPPDPTLSKSQEPALVVFYKDAINSTFVVQPFTVTLNFGGLSGATWTQFSGPTGTGAGTLQNASNPIAQYVNPQVGGLYQFDGSIGTTPPTKVRTSLLLPLAGAEVKDIVASDITATDTFAAAVVARYSIFKRNSRQLNYNFFWNGGNGDYLGRADNASSKTCVRFNPVNTTTKPGFGSVVTWFGVPVRMAKVSNFLVGYAQEKIGVLSFVAYFGRGAGTHDDASAAASYGLGWNIAAGTKSYSTDTVTMLQANFYGSDVKNTRLWPNTAAADNHVSSSTITDFNTQFCSPGFTQITSP